MHLTVPGPPQGPRHLPDADHDAVIAELEGLPAAGARTQPGPHPSRAGPPLEGMKVVDLCVALPARPAAGYSLSSAPMSSK